MGTVEGISEIHRNTMKKAVRRIWRFVIYSQSFDIIMIRRVEKFLKRSWTERGKNEREYMPRDLGMSRVPDQGR